MVAALRDFGLRNAGTPLLIASTPVSAAQPWVNERSTSSISASPVNASPSASSSQVGAGRAHLVAEQQRSGSVPR